MTHEQATKLLANYREMLTIGDEIDAVAHEMAAAGEPAEHFQPLIAACGHLIEAMKATHKAWEEARDHAVH